MEGDNVAKAMSDHHHYHHHHHHHEEASSIMDKLSQKIHHDSSSDSDADQKSHSSFRSKIHRIFGREKPVHKVLGGGKPADIFLWRNKKISGGVLGGATTIYVLFELLEYHLVTLVCHCLIVTLALSFLWSNISAIINKDPPHVPEIHIPEDPLLQFASALRIEVNRGFTVLRHIAMGKEVKKFLYVVAGLWILSVVGSGCNFVTLFYITFILLHTVPVLYEKYEDEVDSLAEKAMHEFNKQFAVFDAKVLSKIPKGPTKVKKIV